MDALSGLIVVAMIVYVVVLIRKKKTGKTGGGKTASAPHPSGAQPQPEQKQTIQCPQCHANLRVPTNRGMIEVTCARCRSKFRYNTGAKSTAASSGAYASGNELDDYRKGGRMWLDIPKPGTHRDICVARNSLIATWVAVTICEEFDENGDTAAFLRKQGGSLECVELAYTESEVVITDYLRNAPIPKYEDRRSYNAWSKDEDKPPIYPSADERLWLRRATLSYLIEKNPGLYMRNGRIYRRKP